MEADAEGYQALLTQADQATEYLEERNHNLSTTLNTRTEELSQMQTALQEKHSLLRMLALTATHLQAEFPTLFAKIVDAMNEVQHSEILEENPVTLCKSGGS